MKWILTCPLMCACKLYAFKHKRTHQTNSPFMSVESEKCNEITGLDCTKSLKQWFYLLGANGVIDLSTFKQATDIRQHIKFILNFRLKFQTIRSNFRGICWGQKYRKILFYVNVAYHCVPLEHSIFYGLIDFQLLSVFMVATRPRTGF